MADTVDSLSIELTASTQSAEDSIQKVIDKLTALKSAVTGASNFNKIVQGIARIAAVASGIDNDAGKKLTQLADGISALSKVGDLSNLKGAGKVLSSVVSAVNGQTSGGKGLSNLAEGIRQTNNALGSIKESDVGKLGAVQDALSGEVSGSLHTSNVTGESAALGGMGGMDVGSSDVAAALGEIANSAASTGSEFEDLLSKNGELSGELETLLEDATQTSKALTDTGDSSKFAKMSLEEMERTIGSVTEQLQAMAGTAETAGNAVQNAMGGGSGPANNGSYEPVRTGQFDVAERFANYQMNPVADSASNATNAINQFASSTRKAGSEADTAARHTNNYGNAAEEAGKAAKRGTTGISNFWQSLKRIAYYRFIRTIIKEITTSFREGFNAVYEWSKSIGGSFASNIDSIKSSVNLLKGSLGALAVPLINSLTPAINGVINVLITMINAFNIAIAAINGQGTYTMAVRGANAVANSVGNVANGLSNVASNAEDASKAMRSILGFDEINKLQAFKDGGSSGGSGGGGGGGSSGGGGLDGITFVEKPLEGIWKKISDITEGLPDWLKWLLTGTALVGGFKLISWLIDKIKDFLSGLVNFSIPDWVKWLFGPKDGNNPGIDIPDHIDIPDGKIKVDVEKGDWSALDEITGKSVYVSPKLDNQGGVLFNKFKYEWDAARTPLYVSPKLDNTGAVLWNGIKSEWDDAGSKTLYLSPKLDNGADTLYANFKNEWDAQGSKALYFSPKLDNTGTVLWNTFKGEWDDAATGVYATPKLNNQGGVLWAAFKKEWDAAATGLYASPKLDNTGAVLWNTLKAEWDNIVEPLKVKVELDYGGTDGFGGATGGGGSTSGGGIGRSIKVAVEPETTVGGKTFWERAKEAIDAAGTAVDKGLDVIVRPALNSAGEKITSIVKWLFGNDNTPDVTTKVNASAGTGFSGVNGNTFTLGGITGSSVTVNGTPGAGFVGQLSGTNKYTLAGIEATKVDVSANLTGPTSNSKALTKTGDHAGVFPGSFDVLTNLTGATDGSKALTAVGNHTGVFPGSFNTQVNLTGATDGSKALTASGGRKGVFSSSFKTKTNLTGKTKGSLNVSGSKNSVFPNSFDVKTNVKKGWKGTALSALGLDNLKTKVKVNLEKGDKDTVIIKPANSKGEVKMEVKRLGGVFFNGIWKSISQFANGGILTNGIWKNIPQYAGGTTNAHGSMFLAGEAGPELVGHLGGRTEVLNQSQLAATMYSAVRAAMGGVKIAATMYDGGSDDGEADYETMYRAMYDAFTDAMAGSKELDRQRNDLLRQINAKDTTVEITAASVNRAQTRMNRRAGTTIVPVGT